MKILFICKYNRTRSKVAEAYFNKINKNKNIKVASAGVIKGRPTGKKDLILSGKFGLKIKKKTKSVKENDLRKGIDLLIIVANDVPVSLFKNNVKKVIVWKIKDGKYQKKYEDLYEQIIEKVNALIKKLEKKK